MHYATHTSKYQIRIDPNVRSAHNVRVFPEGSGMLFEVYLVNTDSIQHLGRYEVSRTRATYRPTDREIDGGGKPPSLKNNGNSKQLL